jgi:hypothetical protein
MSDYPTMAKRIRACRGRDALDREQRSIDRLFAAGVFTPSQYMRLDVLLMECAAKGGEDHAQS